MPYGAKWLGRRSMVCRIPARTSRTAFLASPLQVRVPPTFERCAGRQRTPRIASCPSPWPTTSHWASILGPPTSHPRPIRHREPSPRTANREPDETNHQPLCRWQNVCVSVAHRFHFPRVALPRTLNCIALIVTFADPARLAPWATAGHKPLAHNQSAQKESAQDFGAKRGSGKGMLVGTPAHTHQSRPWPLPGHSPFRKPSTPFRRPSTLIVF